MDQVNLSRLACASTKLGNVMRITSVDGRRHLDSGWPLSVKLDKTKIMIVDNYGKSLNNYLFRYGADELENVKSYQYLGLIMSRFGNFDLAGQEFLLSFFSALAAQDGYCKKHRKHMISRCPKACNFCGELKLSLNCNEPISSASLIPL